MAHGAVLVATEGRTDRGDLERTVHRLETTNCHVLGLVLNHVRRIVLGQLPGLRLQAVRPTVTAGDRRPVTVVVVAYPARRTCSEAA